MVIKCFGYLTDCNHFGIVRNNQMSCLLWPIFIKMMILLIAGKATSLIKIIVAVGGLEKLGQNRK